MTSHLLVCFFQNDDKDPSVREELLEPFAQFKNQIINKIQKLHDNLPQQTARYSHEEGRKIGLLKTQLNGLSSNIDNVNTNDYSKILTKINHWETHSFAGIEPEKYIQEESTCYFFFCKTRFATNVQKAINEIKQEVQIEINKIKREPVTS